MRSEKEIKKKLEKLKDEYVFGMNYAAKFSAKDKYTLQGKIDILEWVLQEDNQ
jgi:hypothetical protein